METKPALSRKRLAKLPLGEVRAARAEANTDELPAAMESLPDDHVRARQAARRSRQQVADARASDWNAVLGSIGSFVDDHTTI